MTPRLSCADFTFPLLPHADVLRLIKMLGVDGVDLGIFEGRSHHFPSRIVTDPVGEAKRLAGDLANAGVCAADVFLQTGAAPSIAAANTPDAALRTDLRETFLRMLDFTATLGCRHLTGLPGVLHERIPFRDDWTRAGDEAGWRLQAAQARDITYSVEAHVGSILPDPETALRFLGEFPGITLTLDCGHFIYQGMTNERIHPLLPHASHVHVRGGAHGRLQSTMKENTIDFAALVRGLAMTGYSGWLCLEYVWVDWEGCNRTDNISETILLKTTIEKIGRDLALARSR